MPDHTENSDTQREYTMNIHLIWIIALMVAGDSSESEIAMVSPTCKSARNGKEVEVIHQNEGHLRHTSVDKCH